MWKYSLFDTRKCWSRTNNQTEIQLIKQWKSEGQRPDWPEIAQYGPELKTYWLAWDSSLIIDGVLYRKKESEGPHDSKLKIILPTALRKKCFTLLHDTVSAGHLGSQKTLAKVRQRFY